MERYDKIKKIGEGSFGKALLVRRKHDGRHCVIKEVNISKMNSKEREESKREVKVLAHLKHPNIVSYQESFEGMGNLYIVMDYCEGGDLYQKLVTQKGTNFSEAQILDYFVQICLALKHIHDRKILHRDLKSQNIFLTKHGIVKLGDFGIARVLKSTVELARTCIGTPYYLSPEICENRPYNNKSDIWSLGCVLYELCTLKHAFQAGNIKNIVLKIIRGNYPPISNRYSSELRALVSQCFKRSPIERPSVNKILKKPLVQARIQKFLSPETMQDEFSHTVIHNEKFGAMRQPGARPVSAGVRRPPSAAAQVYGVSVAKKPPAGVAAVKKPGPVAVPSKRPLSAGKRPPQMLQQQRLNEERQKNLEARERRRRNLAENQEQAYQEYLKNIHKQRYEKQQVARMNRAREAGWKNLLKSDEDENKKKPDNGNIRQDKVMVKQPEPMEKYSRRDKKVEESRPSEIIPEQKPIPVQDRWKANIPEQRQIPPQERPFDAWVAAKQARDHGAKASEAAEKARLIEDFRQRKREAADNKARGNYDYQPRSHQQNRQQPLQNVVRPNPVDRRPSQEPIAPVPVSSRNKEEQSYLEQLERIRRQNFQERKALQNRKAAGYEPSYPASNKPDISNHAVNDPRYDPAARRQKIAALKSQADERAAALREELNKRRRNLQQRLENERIEKDKQRQLKMDNNIERPLPALQNREMRKEKVAVPAVGLETAMGQVAAARLFRSCSEGDLQQMIKKGQDMIHDRKHWNEEVPLGLADLPLEVTASAMEATSVNDAVYRPPRVGSPAENAHARRNWGKEGKTLLINALENKTLANQTCFPPASPEKGEANAMIYMGGKQEPKDASPVGKTIILPKKNSPKIGETITIKNEDVVAGLNPPVIEGKPDIIHGVGEKGEEMKKEANDNSDSLSSVESLKEQVEKSTTGLEEGSLTKTEDDKQSKDADKPTDNDVKKVEDNDEDDDDIEELTEFTVVAPDSQQKPKARSAWGAEVSPAWNFKENTVGSEDNEEVEEDEKNKHVKDLPSENEKAGENKEELFKKIERVKPGEDKEDLEIQDVSADNDSFHTPNTSLLETRKMGLNSGLYDSPAKVLLTTSMPELHNDEEREDYENMLKSLRFVLNSTDEDFSRSSSAASKSVEDNWLSDDDDDDDDNGIREATIVTEKQTSKSMTNKEKKLKAKETLFQRIEESRQTLEDELGTERFLKVYRYIQAMQDNEDDEMDVDPTKDPEIRDILDGNNEHLYQRILYLVLADAAYLEAEVSRKISPLQRKMDQCVSETDVIAFKDEIGMLKDKIAYLQSQLEQSENESIIAAELGQRLLEEKEHLEAIREEERTAYTTKIEELMQENFNLTAKVETGARLLDAHSQDDESADKFKAKLEQEKEELRISCEKKLSDIKKSKTLVDEELSHINLKLSQKDETIESLHKVIDEQKSKNKILEGNTCLEGEMQELKNAFQECYEEKCQIEENLEEYMHSLQSKNLEVDNLTKRMNELNEELEYAQKEQTDCYKHLEDAKDTIAELRVEINQLETELRSRGHSKKGNSLFGELEDKRIFAERNLAIFKVRYDSLQKAHASAKNEILKMKNQVLAFLQTRSDRADRLRIEHLEQAVSVAKAECNMLAAKLKQRDQQLLAKDPLDQLKGKIESYEGSEGSKDYIKLLIVTAEEYKNKIEILKKDLYSQQLAFIAKTDDLQETQRKLYTATNTADKNRNENLRAKVRLEEMKNKLEAEKQKRIECESLIKKWTADKTTVKDQFAMQKEIDAALQTFNNASSKETGEERKRMMDTTMEEKGVVEEKTDDVFVSKNPLPEKVRELTDAEKKEKIERLMKMHLPKDLAEEYLRKNENTKQQKSGIDKISKMELRVSKAKRRKVSFKDEVEDLENDHKFSETNSSNEALQDSTMQSKQESRMTQNRVEDGDKEACHVQ
eukprot:gene7278-8089_t